MEEEIPINYDASLEEGGKEAHGPTPPTRP